MTEIYQNIGSLNFFPKRMIYQANSYDKHLRWMSYLRMFLNLELIIELFNMNDYKDQDKYMMRQIIVSTAIKLLTF